MKKKYGHFASWAVWAEEEPDKPQSNMWDLSVLDPEINKELLEQLNPEVVLVALNFSRGSVKLPFGNFHSDNPVATDFKTRFALRGSPFWGGYMTDIIKDFDEKESGKVVSFLHNNKPFEKENIESFRQELRDLGSKNPILIAFGNVVCGVLKRNLEHEFKILKIYHYASHTTKEEYREQVKTIWLSYYKMAK